ncbi:hypothetical protein D1872_227740 [compost metagenome]
MIRGNISLLSNKLTGGDYLLSFLDLKGQKVKDVNFIDKGMVDESIELIFENDDRIQIILNKVEPDAIRLIDGRTISKSND